MFFFVCCSVFHASAGSLDYRTAYTNVLNTATKSNPTHVFNCITQLNNNKRRQQLLFYDVLVAIIVQLLFAIPCSFENN